MPEEKPLPVRVAEKLGWTWVVHGREVRSAHPGERYLVERVDHEGWHALASGTEPIWSKAFEQVPRYDLDWSATGPLIERLGIELCYTPSATYKAVYSHEDGSLIEPERTYPAGWTAELGNDEGYGATVLEAVCALILALPDEVVRR